MGSAVSSRTNEKYSLWTKEEQEENERCIELQKDAAKYIAEHIFYGIPITWGKKSVNPLSPLWFEVDRNIINKITIDDQILRSVPSGVSVDSNGLIKIFFTRNEVSYNLSVTDLREAARGLQPIADAPFSTDQRSTSLQISWKLPQPPGLTHQVEIQFCATNSEFSAVISEFEIVEANNPDRPSPWQSFCTKSWEELDFFTHTLLNLNPGEAYRFRLRYRTYQGWSNYSNPSLPIFTLPDRPSNPAAPVCGAIHSDTVQLYWSPPQRDNGRAVTQYILRGRSAGDEFAVLYCGPMQFFLATDLYPGFAYSFEVAAVNDIGCSAFSIPTNILIPPSKSTSPSHRAESTVDSLCDTLAADAMEQYAMQCRDAWLERWDPKTEQYFYFNRLTGSRQLDRPAVLDAPLVSSHSTPSTEQSQHAAAAAMAAREQETRFRTKRFRLTRALHKHAAQHLLTAAVGASIRSTPTNASRRRTDSAAPPSPSVSMSQNQNQSQGRPDVFTVQLRRDKLLSDGFIALVEAPLSFLCRRMKVTFVGEAGIDSGGLGKEAFLLLSREAAVYAGPGCRGWMRYCQGQVNVGHTKSTGGFFFSDDWKRSGNLLDQQCRDGQHKPAAVPSSSSSPKSRHLGSESGDDSQPLLLHIASAMAPEAAHSSRSLNAASANACQNGRSRESDSDCVGIRGRKDMKSLSIRTTIDEGDEDAASPTKDKDNKGKGGINESSRSRGLMSSNDIGCKDQEGNIEEMKDSVKQGMGQVQARSTGGASSVMELLRDASITGPQFSFFLGRLLSKALFDRQLVDLSLSPLLLRHLVGEISPSSPAVAPPPIVPKVPSSPVKGGPLPSKKSFGNVLAASSVAAGFGTPPPHSTKVMSPSSALGAPVGSAPSRPTTTTTPASGLDRTRSGAKAQQQASPEMKESTNFDPTTASTSSAAAASKEAAFLVSAASATTVGLTKEEEIELLLRDIRVLDSALYTSLHWMLSNDITDILYETFSVEGLDGEIIDLCADGRRKDVVEANKCEYVRLLADWKTNFAVSDLLQPFLRGFHELAPVHLLQDAGITADELDLILNGRPALDVEEIRAYCMYQGGSSSSSFGEGHKTVVWLWQILRDMTEEERRGLLLFFTGSSRVPLDGYDPPLNITEGVDMVEDSLPRAHTCFNQLVLPNYSSFRKMTERVKFAIANTEGFGMA